MCLYIREIDKEGKIAKNDIQCFKLLLKRESSFLTYYITPVQLYPICLDKTYKAEGELHIFPLNSFDAEGDYTMAIARGAFHTFTTLKALKTFIRKYSEDYFLDGENLAIVACTIPKGTRYFKGKFEMTGLPSYASTALTYGNEEIWSGHSMDLA